METEEFYYAGFWKRFAAYVIDGLIIVYFSSAFRWLFGEMLRVMPEVKMDYDGSQFYAYFMWGFYVVILSWCYHAGMESSPYQATAGKMLTGLFVTDMNGERISFSQATGRHFSKILSGAIFNVGYMMAGFTEKKQALHDQISSCLVLSK